MPVVTQQDIGPIFVSDVTGQKKLRVGGVPADATMIEVFKQLASDLDLPSADPQGRPLSYHARLAREERYLGDLEIASDALVANDHIQLMPNIDAG